MSLLPEKGPRFPHILWIFRKRVSALFGKTPLSRFTLPNARFTEAESVTDPQIDPRSPAGQNAGLEAWTLQGSKETLHHNSIWVAI